MSIESSARSRDRGKSVLEVRGDSDGLAAVGETDVVERFAEVGRAGLAA